MNRFSRKMNIIISIAGLAIVAGIFVYYLMNDHLWKKEIHVGFAGLAGLLIYRLVRSIRQED
jgi:hypothetical protein